MLSHAVFSLHQIPVLHKCLLCLLNAPYCCSRDTFAFSLVICSASLAYCGQGLVSILLRGQSAATWGLSWVRLDVCQRCSHNKVHGVVPVTLWLVDWACSQTGCQPNAGAAVKLVLWLSSLFPRAGVTLEW